MEKLKLNCSLFIAIFLLLAIFRLTVQQEIDVGNLFLQAEERKFKNRNLSTTITSVADCVTCVANNANKYCRDITSSVATGYCCTSAETGTNCGSSTNSKCTSDTSNFPTGTGYFLCPQAMSNSFCGASFDTALTIQDGIDTIINAYYIKSGEMCDYTVKVLDSSGNKFTVHKIKNI